MPISTTTNTNTAQNTKNQYTKDQFASKQVIVCYDTDAIIVQNVILAFNHLLTNYPQWSDRIALVLFVANETLSTENVHFYPNLDRDIRDTVEGLAVVKVALSTSLDSVNDTIPTLIGSHAQCSNEIVVDTSNYKQIAIMLNNSLVSTKKLIFFFYYFYFLLGLVLFQTILKIANYGV